MSNNKVEIWLASSKAEDDVWGLTRLLRNAEEEADKFGTALDEAVNPDTADLGDVFTTLQEMAGALDNAVEKMGELVALMSPQEGNFFDSLLGGVETFNTLADGRSNLESIFDAINTGIDKAADHDESFNIFKALLPETRDFADSIANGIGEYTDAVKAARPEVGTFAAMFPKLSTVLSDAGQKLKNLGSAIATTFASLGSSVTQIAKNTAGWIANTAATVGSTVAQWAQIAATTAWKAVCVVATAVTTAFGAAMTFLTSPIGLVVIGITALIAIIVLLIANWDTVSAKAQEVWGFVQAKFAEFDAFLQNIFATDWTEQFGAFGSVLNAFFANVENVWNSIKSIFGGIVTFIKSVFAGDWKGAWDGIVSIFGGIWEGIVAIIKWPINAIIGFINGLISGIVGGINLVIGALNHISVEIPDWDIFGSLAGKRFGFDFALLNAPQIPYLAKGAVLPANKPFLAMVGDQKHGTNVEAPLATIQEAVANVMVDMIPAMMAGFEAVVNEQRATRQAVESIELGDTVIGQAAARYSRKMAVIKGG